MHHCQQEPRPAGHAKGGASYHPDPTKLCPLKGVANRDVGTIQVHVPFSMTNLAQCKIKVGRCSEDPSGFVDKFQTLTMSFDLAGRGIHIVLSACCTPKGKHRVWLTAQMERQQLSLLRHLAGQLQSEPKSQPATTRWVCTLLGRVI